MSTYDLLAQELREQRALAIQVIERQNELAESLSQQLQDARAENARLRDDCKRLVGWLHDARAWARAWKESARANHDAYQNQFLNAKVLSRQLQDAREEIGQLREALDEARMQERARCLNVINSYVLHTKVKPHGAVGQALSAIMYTLKGSTDD